MSSGERKKAAARGLGWEEAGAEFYQESYPGGELDIEALPRDPHYFATLLPSKQNRATTKRPRGADPRATFKRRNSTRNYNTMGNNTVQNDIHVSMMPDLSENLSNEETTWEEIMLIKAMPVGMSQKKDMKAKLLGAATFRLQGLKQFKWKHRKMWEYLKMRKKEYGRKIELWRNSMLRIEGNFGTGIVTLFYFIKWLMFLNILLAAILGVFIVLPTLLLQDPGEESCVQSNQTTIECCSQRFTQNWTNVTLSVFDVLQGGGILEPTVLFYAAYSNSFLDNFYVIYDMPLAYFMSFAAFFVVSFLAIVRKASRGWKDRLIEGEGQYYKYCNMVFGGWDFSLCNEKSASIKHKGLFYEVKENLEAEKWVEEKKHRTRDEVCRTISVRILVNIIISGIILGIAVGTFFAYQYAMKEIEKEYEEWQITLLEYAPYLCVVLLNTFIPPILRHLVKYEHYNPPFAQSVTLFRSCLVRFASFAALLVCFFLQIRCKSEEACYSEECGTPPCWEIFLGRQIYKLLLLDLAFQILLTFFLNFPRMILIKHLKCKIMRNCKQEFDVGKHALDIIYLQMLIWFGSFYAPVLSFVAPVVFILIFYIKKFACLVNCSPSVTVFRATSTHSLLVLISFGAFILAFTPWLYGIVSVTPSKSCGPFRGLTSVWFLIEKNYQSLPSWVQNSVHFIFTPVILIPLFITFSLALYYYRVVSSANKQMVTVLKKQLVLEGHDKQFLLNRLSAFIKQHQERHKPAARSIPEPTTAAST